MVVVLPWLGRKPALTHYGVPDTGLCILHVDLVKSLAVCILRIDLVKSFLSWASLSLFFK